MNELNKFEYFEDLSIPEDSHWLKSFGVLRKALESTGALPLLDPNDNLSFDYSKCWDGAGTAGQTYYIPGFRTDQRDPNGIVNRLTGKRPLRNIAYLLCHPDAQLRGNKLVQCCGDPYCVNPAHTYLVSNKYKMYDQVYLGVQPEEWEDVRGEILKLEQLRASDEAILQSLAEFYTGPSNQKATYLRSQERNHPHHNLTNDQILTMALQRCAKGISVSNEFGSLDGYLSKYQLKTLYYRAKQDFKDLVEYLATKQRQSDYWSAEEFFTETLIYASKLYNYSEMYEEIVRLIGDSKSGQSL